MFIASSGNLGEIVRCKKDIFVADLDLGHQELVEGLEGSRFMAHRVSGLAVQALKRIFGSYKRNGGRILNNVA
jgi:hypothetical protein